ncbi:acyl carrier protein [Metabacillus rhizolycopersici]|uniref:Acyl carrier protein n=1 Tax=Metabacillus rhizolycopersici TaxID=2875709 RepID=A0ABS7UQX6_9BACI|nr:acyl carrier protein [Metabacillus rhizolycopersici]MBZ5750619.1 acyl carrier protein [Metabacillus rhizolycopersici]
MIVTSTLAELLADILEIEEQDLNFNMKLSDFENWDSVNSLRILTHIEDEFHVRLSMEQYSKVQTVEELRALIEEMSNE